MFFSLFFCLSIDFRLRSILDDSFMIRSGQIVVVLLFWNVRLVTHIIPNECGARTFTVVHDDVDVDAHCALCAISIESIRFETVQNFFQSHMLIVFRNSFSWFWNSVGDRVARSHPIYNCPNHSRQDRSNWTIFIMVNNRISTKLMCVKDNCNDFWVIFQQSLLSWSVVFCLFSVELQLPLCECPFPYTIWAMRNFQCI